MVVMRHNEGVSFIEYEKDRENQEDDRSYSRQTTIDTEQNKLGWLKK